eukprot:g13988.t1
MPDPKRRRVDAADPLPTAAAAAAGLGGQLCGKAAAPRPADKGAAEEDIPMDVSPAPEEDEERARPPGISMQHVERFDVEAHPAGMSMNEGEQKADAAGSAWLVDDGIFFETLDAEAGAASQSVAPAPYYGPPAGKETENRAGALSATAGGVDRRLFPYADVGSGQDAAMDLSYADWAGRAHSSGDVFPARYPAASTASTDATKKVALLFPWSFSGGQHPPPPPGLSEAGGGDQLGGEEEEKGTRRAAATLSLGQRYPMHPIEEAAGADVGRAPTGASDSAQATKGTAVASASATGNSNYRADSGRGEQLRNVHAATMEEADDTMGDHLADLLRAGGVINQGPAGGGRGRGRGAAASGGAAGVAAGPPEEKHARLVLVGVDASGVTPSAEITIARNKTLVAGAMVFVFVQERDAVDHNVFRRALQLKDFANPLSNLAPHAATTKYMLPLMDRIAKKWNQTAKGARRALSFVHYFHSGAQNLPQSEIIESIRRLLVQSLAHLEGGPTVCFGYTARGAAGEFPSRAVAIQMSEEVQAVLLKGTARLGEGELSKPEHAAIRAVKEPIFDGKVVAGYQGARASQIFFHPAVCTFVKMAAEGPGGQLIPQRTKASDSLRNLLTGGATVVQVEDDWDEAAMPAAGDQAHGHDDDPTGPNYAAEAPAGAETFDVGAM